MNYKKFFSEQAKGPSRQIGRFIILKAGGKLILTFQDIDQLRSRQLNTTVSNFISVEKIKKLVIGNGFSNGVDVFTREIKSQKYHCAVSIK